MQAFAIRAEDELHKKSYTDQVRLYTRIGHAKGVVKTLAMRHRNSDIEYCVMAAMRDDSDERENGEKRRACKENAASLEEYKKNYTIVTYDLIEVDQE